MVAERFIASVGDDIAVAGVRAVGLHAPRRPSKAHVDGETAMAPVHNFFGKANMAALGLDLGPLALGTVLGWAGKVPGLQKATQWGEKVGALREVTFEQASHYTPSLFNRLAASATGAVMNVAAIGAEGLRMLGITGLMGSYYGAKLPKRTDAFMQAAAPVLNHAWRGDAAVAMNEVRAALANPNYIHMDNLAKALRKVRGGLDATKDAVLLKQLGTFEAATEKLWKAQYLQAGWKNLPEKLRNAPHAMRKAAVGQGLMNASFVAFAAADAGKNAYDAWNAFTDLRMMYAALTHTKEEDVSTLSLMLGSVPQPVAAARGEMLKEFGPAAVVDAINIGFNGTLAAHHRLNSIMALPLMIGLPLLNQMVVRGALGGTLLPTYSDMKEEEKAHQYHTAESYAKLVGSAWDELRSREGPNSRFAKALGEVYAAEQMPVDKVLEEIESGKIGVRLKHLQAQADALRARMAAESQTTGPHTVHVKGAAAEQKPVLGEHTARLQQHGAHAQGHEGRV